MKSWLLPIIFAIIITTGFGTAFAASTDYFLKIDGIDGEVAEQTHKGEIDIMSWSWGMSQTGMSSTSGAGAGKVQFQDFHFTKSIDKSSPMLMQMVATGEHIKEAKLTLRKAGSDQQAFLVVTFTDLMVSSYSVSGDADDNPTESVSFNFAKIQMEYFPQSPTGTAAESIKSRELTGHVTLIK